MSETDASVGGYLLTVSPTADAIDEAVRIEVLTQWLLRQFERDQQEACNEPARSAG